MQPTLTCIGGGGSGGGGSGKGAQWVIFYTLFRENVALEFR